MYRVAVFLSVGFCGKGLEMRMIVIRLDPQLLSNPDADLRYRIPELLAQRSEGAITDDGYDYVGLSMFVCWIMICSWQRLLPWRAMMDSELCTPLVLEKRFH